MLGQLTEKFRAAIDQLRGKGKIRPEDLQESARQIKLGLLEADVHYKVVQSFIKTVTERLVGLDQIPTLSIIRDLLTTNLTLIMDLQPEEDVPLENPFD
jgi:signal recognition particle subunit SRP54